jgi:DNA-binding response OmpR family regulator
MQEKKILIVDDDREMVTLVKATLRMEDRTFIAASDGVEAVEKAFTEAPDLIVLDVMMPKMNGYQVCRLLKNDKSTWHIPIIMLTAKDRVRDRFYGLSIGADDFIIKPFHQQELKEKVIFLLDKAKEAEKACPIDAHVRTSESDLLSKVNTLLDRKLQEMTFLQYMIKSLVSTFDEDRILKTVLGGITTYLGYRHVVVFMQDSFGAMREVVSTGYPEGPAKRTFDMKDTGTLSAIFHSKEPVVLTGRILDLGPDSSGAPSPDAVRQQGVIPIISREDVMGILVVESRTTEPPYRRRS